MSPGFDFNDFEMPEKNQLLKLFPLHEEIINRLGYSKSDKFLTSHKNNNVLTVLFILFREND
ncbi:MAG: hypothetical protein CM15mP65_05760 [Crocinitomicaceae bacterium]|nr:MAG: hypothetical protein CM15mP65_05760 [Crocinitomicaceae bacterium]